MTEAQIYEFAEALLSVEGDCFEAKKLLSYNPKDIDIECPICKGSCEDRDLLRKAEKYISEHPKQDKNNLI